MRTNPMAGYYYSDRQIQTYGEHAKSAVLWERAAHWEQNANYWKARCLSLEQRVQQHECEGEQP